MKLHGFYVNRGVTCAVRLRKGEAIEAMIARGLEEFERRIAEGMPKPDPKAIERRRVRKVRDAALEAFDSIHGTTEAH